MLFPFRILLMSNFVEFLYQLPDLLFKDWIIFNAFQHFFPTNDFLSHMSTYIWQLFACLSTLSKNKDVNCNLVQKQNKLLLLSCIKYYSHTAKMKYKQSRLVFVAIFAVLCKLPEAFGEYKKECNKTVVAGCDWLLAVRPPFTNYC